MNSKDFKSGDILRATHRELKKGYHPIIYIDGYSDTDFVGAMLTHHADTNRNVKVDSIFFNNSIGYESTYLVKGKFMKPKEWGPFIKINQLTSDGLSFILSQIDSCPLEPFSNYFRRNKT
jgi:hypothetical protein